MPELTAPLATAVAAAVALIGTVVGAVLQRISSRERHELDARIADMDILRNSVETMGRLVDAQGSRIDVLAARVTALENKLADERRWTKLLEGHIGLLEDHIVIGAPPPPPPRPTREWKGN